LSIQASEVIPFYSGSNYLFIQALEMAIEYSAEDIVLYSGCKQFSHTIHPLTNILFTRNVFLCNIHSHTKDIHPQSTKSIYSGYKVRIFTQKGGLFTLRQIKTNRCVF
jgi:hypothetical protein